MQVESAETVVTCYLCLRRVPLAAWRQGHRQECAFSHQQTLCTMKSPENNKIRCPKCRARLKLWPANHGPPFSCSSSHCPVVGRIRSTGQNRSHVKEAANEEVLFVPT